eukprot:5839791-Prymnesium_polylepis.1
MRQRGRMRRFAHPWTRSERSTVHCTRCVWIPRVCILAESFITRLPLAGGVQKAVEREPPAAGRGLRLNRVQPTARNEQHVACEHPPRYTVTARLALLKHVLPGDGLFKGAWWAIQREPFPGFKQGQRRLP